MEDDERSAWEGGDDGWRGDEGRGGDEVAGTLTTEDVSSSGSLSS